MDDAHWILAVYIWNIEIKFLKKSLNDGKTEGLKEFTINSKHKFKKICVFIEFCSYMFCKNVDFYGGLCPVTV